MGSAAALGLQTSVLGRLEKALAAGQRPTVIWLSGASCTGCTISLANLMGAYDPQDVGELLMDTVNLAYHPNLMGAAGGLAVQALHEAAAGDFILAVEGGIPTAFNGHACTLWTDGDQEITAQQAALALAPKAKAVLAVGSCASFGGIPAGAPNPTAVKGVRALTGRPAIHIAGCPPHPDWIVWTIAQLLAGVVPTLDGDGRPYDLFGAEGLKIHDQCPRKGRKEAQALGSEGLCLKGLGCKGPRTRGDCPQRLWNGGTNWCIGANAVCVGCTEKGFPDNLSPFYTSPQPVADTVVITLARYSAAKKQLKVYATSSAPPESVTLTAVGYGPLAYKTKTGDYRGVFKPVATQPASVTVVSSGGGAATKAVSA
jgi:hydrogenase small subunit